MQVSSDAARAALRVKRCAWWFALAYVLHLPAVVLFVSPEKRSRLQLGDFVAGGAITAAVPAVVLVLARRSRQSASSRAALVVVASLLCCGAVVALGFSLAGKYYGTWPLVAFQCVLFAATVCLASASLAAWCLPRASWSDARESDLSRTCGSSSIDSYRPGSATVLPAHPCEVDRDSSREMRHEVDEGASPDA